MTPTQTIQALAVSPGVAIGHVTVLRRLVGSRPERRTISDAEVPVELERLAGALKRK